jgi:hypothetical protein
MKCVATRNRRTNTRLSAVLSLGLLLLLSACGGPKTGAEEQLRQWVSAAQAAAEAKERRALVAMISPAYEDAKSYDRDDIEKMLRAYFFRQSNIKLLTSIQEIRVFGGSAAEIDLTVAMAGTNDGVLGFSADAYRFQLELVLDGDDWLLISARWGELGEEMK